MNDWPLFKVTKTSQSPKQKWQSVSSSDNCKELLNWACNCSLLKHVFGFNYFNKACMAGNCWRRRSWNKLFCRVATFFLGCINGCIKCFIEGVMCSSGRYLFHEELHKWITFRCSNGTLLYVQKRIIGHDLKDKNQLHHMSFLRTKNIVFLIFLRTNSISSFPLESILWGKLILNPGHLPVEKLYTVFGIAPVLRYCNSAGVL